MEREGKVCCVKTGHKRAIKSHEGRLLSRRAQMEAACGTGLRLRNVSKRRIMNCDTAPCTSVGGMGATLCTQGDG